ncbi:toll/interleukin-1 receptor domain-containing protein [Paenibacillus nicotianae]|uniref:Toll/interleukin-1 receptor domain-containing protein n=1 Tax=Paenibacillus nicotianae TaxID=1526551 RepID=A0ABW4UQZ0_9BACL
MNRNILPGDIYLANTKNKKFSQVLVIEDTGHSCIVVEVYDLIEDSKDKFLFEILIKQSKQATVKLNSLKSIKKEMLIKYIETLNKNQFFSLKEKISKKYTSNINSLNISKYADSILQEKNLDDYLSESNKESINKTFDIFLSHSSIDKLEIAGIKKFFNELGFSVYVDWLEDKNLKRGNVTQETAITMRNRMSCSNTLIFAYSKNSPKSVWMPWELGYCDGLNKKIAIMPIEQFPRKSKFKGQEYLTLYDQVEEISFDLMANNLRILKNNKNDISFKEWFELS